MQELSKLYKIFPLYQELFKEQLEFVLAPSRYSAALCSRRAGKTTACAVYAIQELLHNPGSLGLYLALTDESVEKIFMPIVQPLIKKYKVSCIVKKDELKFSNGSTLSIYGANHPNKIEGFRGTKLRVCIIDEAASFKEDILRYLIDEIILYALSDLGGRLLLVGTPASHCSGMFYNITTFKEGVGVWDVKMWNAFDNPHQAKQHDIIIEDICRSKKSDRYHPKILREGYGQWATDDDDKIIKDFTVTNEKLEYKIGEWRSVIGVDFGFNDKTAFSVIGWRYNNPTAYVLETIEFDGKANSHEGSVSKIGSILQELKRRYRPLSIVGDPAGASKLIMDEFSRKHSIAMKSAEKSNKAHYLEILSDALLNESLLLTHTTTKLQDQLKMLVWNEEHTREREGQPCDHFDATLYCFREARAYLEKIPIVEVKDPVKDWEDKYLAKKTRDVLEKANATKDLDPFFSQVRRILGE